MHIREVVPVSQVRPNNNMWKSGRVQSGMSMEDLKQQTALRLANEQRDDPDDVNNRHAVNVPTMHSPAYISRYPQQQQQHQQYHQQPYRYYDGGPPHPSQSMQQQQYDSRNYTDSLLGIQQQQQQPPVYIHRAAGYTTPRSANAIRSFPLQDRGSVENRSEGEAVMPMMMGSASSAGGAAASAKTPLKAVGSCNNLKSSGSLKKTAVPVGVGRKDVKDGRVTPVRDVEQQPPRTLYSTPINRREISSSTPTSVYSEPNRKSTNNINNNRSPRQSHLRSPDYHKRNIHNSTPSNNNSTTNNNNNNTHYYKTNTQQSKLPHGLTVQELKEMTRARLAAEANYEGDSVHSGGTTVEETNTSPPLLSSSSEQYLVQHSTTGTAATAAAGTKGSYGIPYRKTSADGMSIGSGGTTSHGTTLNGYGQHPPPPQVHSQGSHPPSTVAAQGLPGQPPQHHPRMHVQTSSHTQGPPPPPILQYPYPRHPSPVYQKTRPETWEGNLPPPTAEYQLPDLYHNTNGPSFSSPMNMNRGRCFSAGATTSSTVPSGSNPYEASSWEEASRKNTNITNKNDAYRPNSNLIYEGTSQEANHHNRPRCATLSPPGMSRLHEDRPFLFSDGEKDRLAVPPLSEPRPRFHTTGILGSAFEPISSLGGGHHHHTKQLKPPTPPSLAEHVKFNVEDRMMSTGSNGDLPSSVAEAVLGSLTASTGPVDLFDAGSTAFRSSSNEDVGQLSPFRKSSSQEYSQLDRIVTESSGSGSIFSSGPSQKSFFSSSEYNNDRMLSMTNSWGGEVSVGEDTTSFGFSQEFNNLLIGGDGPALRGRAQTAPCFGENHALGSKLDPEHRLEESNTSNNWYDSVSSSTMLGFGGSSQLPPGFDKPFG